MYTIQRHLQFNAWADGKMVEMLTNVDEKLFDQEVKSSFPSLRKTVMHIWDAEQVWFLRIKGIPFSGWPGNNFKGNTQEMLNGYVDNSKALAEFMLPKDRAFFDTLLNYKNMQGLEYTQPIEDILFHVVNHASFHRGQLITMMRELGLNKFTNTDLITYMRLQTNQQVSPPNSLISNQQ